MESQGANASLSSAVTVSASTGCVCGYAKEVKKEVTVETPKMEAGPDSVLVEKNHMDLVVNDLTSDDDAGSSKLPDSVSAHDTENSKPKIYSCQYCEKTFTNPQVFGGHQNAHRYQKKLARRGLGVDHRYSPYHQHIPLSLRYPTLGYQLSYSSVPGSHALKYFEKPIENTMLLDMGRANHQRSHVEPQLGSGVGWSRSIAPRPNILNHPRMDGYRARNGGLGMIGGIPRAAVVPPLALANGFVNGAICDVGNDFSRTRDFLGSSSRAITQPGESSSLSRSSDIAISNMAANKAIGDVNLHKKKLINSALITFGGFENADVADTVNGGSKRLKAPLLGIQSPGGSLTRELSRSRMNEGYAYSRDDRGKGKLDGEQELDLSLKL